MKKALIILTTVSVAGLWLLPLLVRDKEGFGYLYIPVFIMSFAWGIEISHYLRHGQ